MAGSPVRRRVLLVAALVAALLLGYGAAGIQPYVFRAPLVLGQDAITDAASARARVSLDDVGGPVISIRPESGDGRLLLIMYPGGLVRPQAYEWLGRTLADNDVHTVIPEMPLDLAVLDSARADALVARYADGRPVVIAGHSLGGAMAAQWASGHADRLAGMVLMAAYPPDGVTVAGIPVLSLLAENDRVADPGKVRGGLDRLGNDTELVVVPGAVHAFFGRYGPQAGDGTPTVSREQAQESIAGTISGFLAGIG